MAASRNEKFLVDLKATISTFKHKGKTEKEKKLNQEFIQVLENLVVDIDSLAKKNSIDYIRMYLNVNLMKLSIIELVEELNLHQVDAFSKIKNFTPDRFCHLKQEDKNFINYAEGLSQELSSLSLQDPFNLQMISHHFDNFKNTFFLMLPQYPVEFQPQIRSIYFSIEQKFNSVFLSKKNSPNEKTDQGYLEGLYLLGDNPRSFFVRGRSTKGAPSQEKKADHCCLFPFGNWFKF